MRSGLWHPSNDRDTNCKGLAYVTRAILPGMIARNRGHIVNLGSIAAHVPYPG